MNYKRASISLFTLILAVSVINFTRIQKDVEDVKDAVETGYVHGAFNELNPEAMAKTFHKDFAIFSTDGENLRKYPIANWVESVKRQKNDPEFDPKANIWEHKFVSVDVTGNSAAVKIELYHEGEHVYTDYLSLLKFNEGWKIVAKVYNQHS